MEEIQFDIRGMSCGGCVASVRRALAGVAGLTVKDVTIGSATVETDGGFATIENAKVALDDAGFAAEVRAP